MLRIFIKYNITGPGMLSGYSAPGNCDFDPIFGDQKPELSIDKNNYITRYSGLLDCGTFALKSLVKKLYTLQGVSKKDFLLEA